MMLPKSVFCVSNVCDSESTRYALSAVQIERDTDGKALAVATDGRRLMLCRWDDTAASGEYPGLMENMPGNDRTTIQDCEAVPGFTALVPAESWKEAAQLSGKLEKSVRKLATTRQSLANVLIPEHKANGRIPIVACDGTTTRTLDVQSAEGRFPRWREVLPNYTTLSKEEGEGIGHARSVRVILDHELLAELVKLVGQAAGLGDEVRGVELEVPISGNGPVVMRARPVPGGPEVTGVLMPLTAV